MRSSVRLFSALRGFARMRRCPCWRHPHAASYCHPASLGSKKAIDSSEYKIKPYNDPDTFGNLSYEANIDKFEGDEGDKSEDTFLQNLSSHKSKLRTKQYADMIKKYIHEKKFADAIDVLEKRMIKDDQVKPETYIYSLLIGACGRWGYTKKAFQLYNQMKKRGLKVNDATYTGLLNACANSPWPEDGLKRATHLRELMIEKGVNCNATHYHAMIKAFGRCGDIKTAFQLVDEMVDQKLALTDETFNFLLQACISDKEAGFRHAILVWQKMLQKKIKPNLFSYNLVLRCVKNCGLGELDVAQNVLQQMTACCSITSLSNKKLITSNENEQNSSLPYTVSNNSQAGNNEITPLNNSIQGTMEDRPNLLSSEPNLGTIISLVNITEPQDRLLLIGGHSGFLQQMEINGIKPDIKTYTLLLECLPPTISAEKALLSVINKSKLTLDVDFFNMLIKKRSMRFDYYNAREVLRLIQAARLQPDIITFGVLALGCTQEEEAEQLLTDMKNAGYRMNTEILGAMISQACAHYDLNYILKILNITKQENIKPNAQYIRHIENFMKRCTDIKKNKEENLNAPALVKSKFFKKFSYFKQQYKAWLEEVDIEQDPHPWQQFQQKPMARNE